MNITALRQRLEKLEALSASAAAPQPLHPLTKLLDILVAYHLGGLAGNDSIASGMARALGYHSPRNFRTALLAGAESSAFQELNVRWRGALARLFALKGADVNCDGPTFGGVVEALFREMPDHLRQHPFISPDDGFPEAVYDFLL